MRILFSILMILSFCGCTHYAPPGKNHPVRVVTQVDVIASSEGKVKQYSYSDEDKIAVVLHYIRKLSPFGQTSITPDTFRTDAYEIVLTMSDGSKIIYHQIYDSYLQKGNGPWQKIETGTAGQLPKLLQILPSDKA